MKEITISLIELFRNGGYIFLLLRESMSWAQHLSHLKEPIG